MDVEQGHARQPSSLLPSGVMGIGNASKKNVAQWSTGGSRANSSLSHNLPLSDPSSKQSLSPLATSRKCTIRPLNGAVRETRRYRREKLSLRARASANRR